jgi:dTMP kinase
MTTRPGCLIVFEGLDQSGKETQARELLARFTSGGRLAELIGFPDYRTPIGQEIERALAGERDYPADVMQLLYVANRYEWKPAVERHLASGRIVIADRYLASSIAYGEAHGLDPAWLFDIQRFLPQPDLTLMLDIAPATAVRRKQVNRDRYERDLDMLARVRQSYQRQAAGAGWVRIDGEQPADIVARQVADAVSRQLALL